MDNPRVAAVLDQRVVSHAIRLIDFPYSGRNEVVTGTRELLIPRTPYLAVYSVSADTVLVLRVLHGAQQWPDSE
jgi:toxin ParE1/3/4